MKSTMIAKSTKVMKRATQMKWLAGKTAKHGLSILFALMLMLLILPTSPAIGSQVFAAEGGTPENEEAFEIVRQSFFEELANGADNLGPLETIIIEDEPQIIEEPFVEVPPESYASRGANIEEMMEAEVELGYTEGPFVVGDERLFDARVQSTVYKTVKGKLIAQGKHVNIWALDDDDYHRAAGTTHSEPCYLPLMTPAACNDIANIIDAIYERMTDPETGFAPHEYVRPKANYSNMPYCGDIDNDGMMNYVFYPMNHFGVAGFFTNADFFLHSSPSTGNSCYLDVVHVTTTIFNTSNPLYYFGTLAHEFQHFLFYTNFNIYNGSSGSISWINESLSELTSIYYIQPGAEVLVSDRFPAAAKNPYASATADGYFDFVNFRSDKGYGVGSLMSYMFHKATGGDYENNIYKYFRDTFSPSVTNDEFTVNRGKTSGRTMSDVWGDVAEYAFGFNTSGESAFAQMYWLFMEAFATDGGTIHGDTTDVPTTKLYSGVETTGNLWSQRNFDSNNYPLTNGGTIQLEGYGASAPRGNATHEKIYRLDPDPGTGTNTVLNITINDPGAGDSTKYYVALKRLGNSGDLPNADIYPLVPGTPRQIYTNGKEAYLFAATLYRDVISTLSYSWTAPGSDTLDGSIKLNNYLPRPGTVLIATVTPSGSYNYAWTSGEDPVGSNQDSYTTAATDIGKVISVTATSQTLTSGSLQTQTVAVLRIRNTNIPNPPEEQTKTCNSVTLVSTAGYEYSINNALWQDSPVFSGLLPDTEYSFYQRQKATDTTDASYASSASKITTLAFAPTDTLVTAAAISGVTSPAATATPSTDIDNGTGFTATLSWDGSPILFEYSTVYTATITLTAAPGFTFSGGYTSTSEIAGFTVNGKMPTNWISNNGSVLVFQVEFPETAPLLTTSDVLVEAAAISGITSPVAMATPSTGITNGTGFTATLSWDGSPPTFSYSTIYTATITLTAESGYTFDGDYTNTAEISGFTVNSIEPTEWISNDGSELVFKVEFPATEAPPTPPDTLIVAAAIGGVTSPVAMATPSTGISNGTGFTATLSWDGSPSQFGYSTSYTATITLTAESGYTFDGDYTNTAEISGFKINGIEPSNWISNDGSVLVFKVEFPATAAAPTYTVTYNYNNGKAIWVDPTLFSYGEIANDYLYPPITDGGLVIVGWYLEPACINAWDYIVTSNITVYAKWEPISVSYRIEYIDNVNGAPVPPAASLTKPAWTTVSTVKPISAGSTFQGWSTSPTAGGVEYAPGDWIYVDGTIILYAIWSPSHYTITYDSTGGTPISPQRVDITADRWTTLSTMKPTRADGAVFVCWVTKPYTAEYTPGSWIYVDRDIDLFAVWSDSKYDVGYDYTTENGGYVWHEDALYGSEANYEFYAFNSKIAIWCKDPSCAPGTEWVYGTDKITGPTMLYAKWIPDKVTVAYHYGAASPSVVYQESVGFAFTRGTQDYGKAVDYWTHGTDQFNIGLLFDGWFADAFLTTPYVFGSPLTGDLSLYAKWSVATNYAIVRYDYTTEAGGYVWTEQADLNSEANYEFFVYGDKIAIWCKDASCTMPWEYAVDRITVNTTLYAKWIPAEVTVTYHHGDADSGSAESEVFSFAFNRGTEEYEYPATTHNWATGSDVFGNGYLFQGWYKDPGYTQSFNFGDPITGDLTLYANWGIA